MSSNNNNTFFFVVLLVLLILTSTMAVGAAARPAPANKSMTYAAFKPPVGQRAAGVFDGCLPKGFHRNSGPSRYINYEPAGGTTTSTIIMCDTEKH
ncbi:unnamed protein product [Linum tenue]|uniref:Uncharacterized protein n=1 Tax=Linum tenue TaxID=586396 RepID=A0AAV0JPR1_9ROSI|nr:unnamed protein product [Linum tenue]